MTPQELQRAQDEAIRTAPGDYERVGSAAAAAHEDHSELRAARRTGAPPEKITGLEMSAKAMTDAAIAEWPDENPAHGEVGDPTALGFVKWSDAKPE